MSASHEEPVARLREVPLDAPVAAPLLADLEADLCRRYDDPHGAGAPLDPAAFARPHGTFLVAELDGRPVACGGLRTRAPGVGEVKRMWVDPSARGRGLARALLAGLEEAAAQLGMTRLLLETGLAQPEAVALYASAGWERTEPYGEWRDSPLSVCFSRPVGRGAAGDPPAAGGRPAHPARVRRAGGGAGRAGRAGAVATARRPTRAPSRCCSRSVPAPTPTWRSRPSPGSRSPPTTATRC